MNNIEREKEWLLQEKYNGNATPEYEADCARLAGGEPLAYLIGHVPFLDATIYLDSKPLIPRPETEYWVKKIIDEMPKDKRVQILDLCAGSGCIGIAVLKHVPNSRVDFSDIDPIYFPTIQKNLRENGISQSRATLVVSDLFQNISTKYNYILTNPPYIDEKAHTVEKSVADHEPHEALFGGKNGMEYIEKIIAEAPKFLAQNGTLVVEHEPAQSKAIRSLGTSHFSDIQTHKDQFGVERFSILK